MGRRYLTEMSESRRERCFERCCRLHEARKMRLGRSRRYLEVGLTDLPSQTHYRHTPHDPQLPHHHLVASSLTRSLGCPACQPRFVSIGMRKGGRRLGLGVSSSLRLYVGFVFAGFANPDAIVTSWLFPAAADLASPADDATERLAGSGDVSSLG